MRFWSLWVGLRVWSFGFKGRGLGLRAWGSRGVGVGVSGFWVRVEGLGGERLGLREVRVWGLGVRVRGGL